MSRVAKQFLKQMMWPVGISGGYVALAFLSGYVGELLGFAYWEAFFAVPVTLSLIYCVGFLIYIEWDRARDTVKRENDSILRAMKDD